jgi:hypothetical protein
MEGADGDLHCCFVIQAVPPYHYDLNQMLALPSGFRYRNRYSETWVDPNLRSNIKQLRQKRLLLVMRDKERNRLVPARWATIDHAQPVGNVFYFEYRLGDLVEYSREPDTRETEIHAYTRTLRRYHAELPGTPHADLTTPSVFLSAAGNQLPTAPADDLTHWGNVVGAVATAAVYEKVDFLKVVDLRTSHHKRKAALVNDRYEVAPNTVYTLLVFQTMPNFGDGIVEPHDVNLLTFPGHVASLRNRQRAVGKYDMLTFDLKVLDLPPNERTSIEVAYDPSCQLGVYDSSSLHIPLMVRQRRTAGSILRYTFACIALVLLFLPMLVPADTQIVRNVATVGLVLAIAGAGRTLQALWHALP